MSELKAYAVTEEDEGTGGIVFARSKRSAISRGAPEYGGEPEYYTAHRAEWADEFAPGPVPFKAMFEHGWWQDCHHCGQRISTDECDADEDLVFDIVQRGRDVFCRPACAEAHDKDEEERARIVEETIADLTASLLQVIPGALPAGRPHIYVPRFKRIAEQGILSFEFPGCRIGFAHWRFDKIGEKPHLTVCGGDMPAFRRWRAAGYPPHLMDAPCPS